MNVIIFILLVYGLTNIIVRGSIFEGIKDQLENASLNTKNKLFKKILMKTLQLLNCPMCSGFHVGWFVGIFFGPFVSWNIIFNGAFYSGTTWIINALVTWLGQGQDPERDLNIFVHPDSSISFTDNKDINTEEG